MYMYMALVQFMLHVLTCIIIIIITHICIQERKKRIEEKKQRKLENQKKAELVQKICTVVPGIFFPPWERTKVDIEEW